MPRQKDSETKQEHSLLIRDAGTVARNVGYAVAADRLVMVTCIDIRVVVSMAMTTPGFEVFEVIVTGLAEVLSEVTVISIVYLNKVSSI